MSMDPEPKPQQPPRRLQVGDTISLGGFYYQVKSVLPGEVRLRILKPGVIPGAGNRTRVQETTA